jgi:hypothetical protein
MEAGREVGLLILSSPMPPNAHGSCEDGDPIFGRLTMQVLADDDKGLVKLLVFAGRETVR